MADEITVTITGPVFDGRAAKASEALSTALETSLGNQAKEEVSQALTGAFKHSTGAFVAGIQTSRNGSSVSVHNDMVYSRWLEGTSSRNAPVTVFPGYHEFEKTTAKINTEAERLAEKIVPPYLAAMN